MDKKVETATGRPIPLRVVNPVRPVVSDSPAGIDRRKVLQGLLGGVGVGIAGPALGEPHPVQHHLASPSLVAEAEAKAKAPDWKPEFLDLHQHDTLAVLAERIVPGSTQAHSSQFIDRLLSVDTRENQQKFLGSLGAIEGEAITRFRRPWKALTEAQQVEILTAVSTAASGRDAKGPPTLRDHFDDLKGWIAGAYFSSEIGMKELGYTGAMFFESFPGCTHPDGHR